MCMDFACVEQLISLHVVSSMQVCKYPFSKPGFYHGTGHFTQMVWTTTKLVGCAIGKCPGGIIDRAGNRWKGTMLVCEYWPPGRRLCIKRQRTNDCGHCAASISICYSRDTAVVYL